MTECNRRTTAKSTTNPITFSSLGRKRVVADFAGGRLTSDAGGLLLREVDRRIGLVEAITGCIRDGRDGRFITHSISSMLRQRIFAIAMGYEDLNDHQTLRDDALLQLLAGVADNQPLASPPTLCRLENRIDRRDLARMAEVFVEQFIASHNRAPEEIILDFDATDDPIHGNQEGRFFHGYYDNYCFLPLYVFCGEQLLAAYLRPSKIDAPKHSRAILKLLVKRFRHLWPNVRIIFRGDSGFCRWRLMRWCDRHDVHYIIGLARNPVLERLAEPWSTRAEGQFRQTHQKQRLFGQIQYAAATWDRRRRVIVKAEYLQQGPNNRFLVTNLPGEPLELYDKLYCRRGDMENRIKEQQLDLFADRTSCHRFLPNQFRLMLSSAAYVLVETLRRVGLLGTQLARAQCATIRTRLLKIGARVVVSARRIVLHLATGYPLASLLRAIVARLVRRTPPLRRSTLPALVFR